MIAIRIPLNLDSDNAISVSVDARLTRFKIQRRVDHALYMYNDLDKICVVAGDTLEPEVRDLLPLFRPSARGTMGYDFQLIVNAYVEEELHGRLLVLNRHARGWSDVDMAEARMLADILRQSFS